MALQGFFHVNSLFVLPISSRKTRVDGVTGIVKERVHMVGKEVEGKRKKARKSTLPWPGFEPMNSVPNLSALSIKPWHPAT